jgi:hypothetical protein
MVASIRNAHGQIDEDDEYFITLRDLGFIIDLRNSNVIIDLLFLGLVR